METLFIKNVNRENALCTHRKLASKLVTLHALFHLHRSETALRHGLTFFLQKIGIGFPQVFKC